MLAEKGDPLNAKNKTFTILDVGICGLAAAAELSSREAWVTLLDAVGAPGGALMPFTRQKYIPSDLLQSGALCGNMMTRPFSQTLPFMLRTKTLKRFMVSLDAGDYAAPRALAEAQQPPLSFQCLVRRTIRRFPDQPEGRLLKPAGDTSR